MRAYYLEGDNIEWLIGVCLILFVIGVVGALAMFVIPEKINLRVCRANVFFFSALMAVVAFVTLIVFTSRSFTMRSTLRSCRLSISNASVSIL